MINKDIKLKLLVVFIYVYKLGFFPVKADLNCSGLKYKSFQFFFCVFKVLQCILNLV